MQQVIEVALPAALILVMFCLGLELRPSDFGLLLRRPRAFLVGLAAQVVLLPAVAFAIILLLGLPPAAGLGLAIIAAAPGGVTSNALTRFAGGDTALSIALTAVINLLSVATVPAVIWMAFQLYADAGAPAFSVLATALATFGMVTAPVLAGMGLRALAPEAARRHAKGGLKLALVLLVFVISASIFGMRDRALAHIAIAGPAVLTLNLTMMTLAWFGPQLLGVAEAQRIALSLECGLQNVTLAISLVVLMGLPTDFAVPAAVYGMLMLVTASLFALALGAAGRRARASNRGA